MKWFRKMFGFDRERRVSTRSKRPDLPPLPSTAGELARTESTHLDRIAKADRLLKDFEKFDGSLRLVLRRR